MGLHRGLHRAQDGVEERLRVGAQRGGLGRVAAQVEEQGGLVEGDVARRTETDVSVETARGVLRVEIWSEVKGFPH